METLFVYYKVPLARHGDLLARVLAFQERLRQAWPGLAIELMQRPQASADGDETWMEVYRHPRGVTDALTAAITQLASEMGLPKKRASEIFIPLRH